MKSLRFRTIAILLPLMVCAGWQGASLTFAANVTLSDQALMSLDYPYSSETSQVMARRDVPGPGVEFDIYFPSNVHPGDGVYYVSSKFGGAGTLAGLDLSTYDYYALKFSLLAVDGVSSPGTGGALVVGALVNGSEQPYAYNPEVIDLGSYHGTTDISMTPASYALDVVDEIGFHAHFFTETGWSASGTTVTLFVAPAPGAVAVPEPGSLSLAMIGMTYILRRRRRCY